MESYSISEIDSIYKAIRKMSRRIEIERDDDTIKIKKGSKKLEINNKGEVKASMPLHSFKNYNTEDIGIGDNEIKINFGKGTYIFKI